METFDYYILTSAKYAVILLSFLLLCRCVRSMLQGHSEPEVWAALRLGSSNLYITHWENLIGRSLSADARIPDRSVHRAHAVLVRDNWGEWKIYDVFHRSGVWVNGQKVGLNGLPVESGDILKLGEVTVRFALLAPRKRAELERRRSIAGGAVSPFFSLNLLTALQGFLLLEHKYSANPDDFLAILLCFAGLILTEWTLYMAMRTIRRSGFEPELLGFYLTTLGVSVTASSVPGDMFKELLLLLASVLLFLLLGFWMRNLRRTDALRLPMAVISVALLAVNLALGVTENGATNWLELGGFRFQPSELVKVCYIYFGASTLDSLYRRQNLLSYIVFSAACVIALALMGDFGTALIFFVCFLLISFMRSGSIATVLLAVSGAGLAGFLAVSVKPYIAQRFAAWGHVWEDIYDKGYQQTRAMSAAASGGLFGKGAGAGWLKNIVAANTDMVFAVLCEELGLIVALCAVGAILALAFFAFRNVRNSRSAFYAISSCASVTVLMVQLALNVFGSLDLLPFTGVTFPCISHGGSSLLSCWMLLSFIKAADNRKSASFAVALSDRHRKKEAKGT